jgi:hypothetical protein
VVAVSLVLSYICRKCQQNHSQFFLIMPHLFICIHVVSAVHVHDAHANIAHAHVIHAYVSHSHVMRTSALHNNAIHSTFQA